MAATLLASSISNSPIILEICICCLMLPRDSLVFNVSIASALACSVLEYLVYLISLIIALKPNLPSTIAASFSDEASQQ
ncbi:hypothetical protein [Paraglaciecola psychrophila]|uniref:Uncharacterized protein n=1 Tax=Paraglaciecola psychrophila 170 TaxID=1129794 RepID=K6ZQB5_9ALTE|nr:hypothetical protein [Paraglaciecola psychrophila]AGH45476.1 hypothetical protein C427_3367 [Paraglaciecola psychrophila 170]GAC38141.1 hypothetical protein GPSY_2527 [Paraglaciecola psychrophila 170]